MRELYTSLKAQGISPMGSMFSYHFRMDPDMFDFEVGVPVAEPVEPNERVVPSSLPACTVARTSYIGPYEGLSKAWTEFNAWIKAQGHEPAANMWEVYIAGPDSGSDPALWRTELNRPLIILASAPVPPRTQP